MTQFIFLKGRFSCLFLMCRWTLSIFKNCVIKYSFETNYAHIKAWNKLSKFYWNCSKKDFSLFCYLHAIFTLQNIFAERMPSFFIWDLFLLLPVYIYFIQASSKPTEKAYDTFTRKIFYIWFIILFGNLFQLHSITRLNKTREEADVYLYGHKYVLIYAKKSIMYGCAE